METKKANKKTTKNTNNKNGFAAKSVQELLTLKAKTSDPNISKKIRKALRKQGYYISEHRKQTKTQAKPVAKKQIKAAPKAISSTRSVSSVATLA